jgi:tetratricopeptide (TPR) repeat protein
VAKNKNNQDNIEKELSVLNESAGNLMESAFCASAFKLYGELRSKARAEGQLGYYVIGTFFQMNLAKRLLQFETVRERAIELIALFEDEEQARKIEPSLDLDQYDGIIYSMGACAYEVLAEATGDLDGFNSEGMQECLTGGIEVCHRIGKLSCLQCFREYACDIHTAADDYELARYHCNQVLQQTKDFPERGDRRWLAMLRLATMDVLEGQHESGRTKLEQATVLAEASSVTDQVGAQVSVMLQRYTLDLLEGRAIDDRTEKLIQGLPPRGECPEYDLDVDCLAAIGFAMHQNWDEAEKLLVHWNKMLKQNKAITKWLETGIRLVALFRLKGDYAKAKRLAVQFEEAATKANDWQSIRRLLQVTDESIRVTPLGTVVRNTRAASSVPHAEPPNIASELDKGSNEDPVALKSIAFATPTPLSIWMDELTFRMQSESRESEKRGETRLDVTPFRAELMNRAPEEFTHPEDIGRALYLMNFLITPDCDRVEVWKWANRVVSAHQDVAYLISLLGRLGMTISMLDRLTAEIRRSSEESQSERSSGGGLDPVDDDDEESEAQSEDERDQRLDEEDLPAASITNERLEQLIRKSLQIDAKGVNNNFRAAEVFEYIGNAGEAERCFARAFKLDRTRDDAALALSRIYSETDRIQDSLYVLDLCIREGGSSAELLFEAALKAHALTQHELQVSFLQQLHERFEPIPWSYYYLSSGLLELKRPQEALDAIGKEIQLFQSSGLHIDSVKAAAYAQIGQSHEAVLEVKKALAYQLSKIDDLTISGISGAYERLITAAKMCPNEEAVQSQVEEMMLKIGIATESYFEQVRSHEKPCDLYLFQCYLSQPLDEDWKDSQGCLNDQTEWEYYVAQWGVLARDSEEASELALLWQAKCYPLEAIVIEVDSAEEQLHDRPGIAFQGPRYPDMDEDDEDDFDDEDDY